MSCQGCVANVNGVLTALPGVAAAEVSLAAGEAKGRLRPGPGQPRDPEGGHRGMPDSTPPRVVSPVSIIGSPMNTPEPLRLTQLSHGGGCGCKIAPASWKNPRPERPRPGPTAVAGGHRDRDDAAVYQINERQAIVATTDFFMPIVDDPSTSAASPPPTPFPTSMPWAGRRSSPLPWSACRSTRCPWKPSAASWRGAKRSAGGGDSHRRRPHRRFGRTHLRPGRHRPGGPAHVKRNSGAQAGDRLILGKPLGVGVSAAFKKGRLSPSEYEAMIASTTQLQHAGADARLPRRRPCRHRRHRFRPARASDGVCKGSGVAATLDFPGLPLLPHALDLVRAGNVTGASGRNWASYGERVALAPGLGEAERALLCDPQTSGGLLVSCSADTVTEVLSIFLQQGFNHAAVIGEIAAGAPAITVA